MGRDRPGELEHMILLAIARLGEEAFALSVLEELDRTARRHLSRGALYKALDRLETKGFVAWETEDSTPDRGGHPRRRFELTPEGVAVLRATRETLSRLWDGLDPVLGPR